MDFIVLDTQPVANPSNQIPVILGRPFLATSNALINCRNGVMKLTFGNMTLETNIFNVDKQSDDDSVDDDIQEVSMIETLVQDGLSTPAYDPLEDDLFDDLDDYDDDFFTSTLHEDHALHIEGWRPRLENFEELPPIDPKSLPSPENQSLHMDGWKPTVDLFENLPLYDFKSLVYHDYAPDFEFTSLPSKLNYVFFGLKETFSKTILSKVDSLLEGISFKDLQVKNGAIGWIVIIDKDRKSVV